MKQEKITGGIGIRENETPRVVQVIVSNDKSIGDGSIDNPHRRLFQVFSLDGTLLAEYDDQAKKLNRTINLKKISIAKKHAHERTVNDISLSVHSHFNSMNLKDFEENVKKSGLSITDYIAKIINNTDFSVLKEDGE